MGLDWYLALQGRRCPYGFATALGGSGFIAAFLAGTLFGALVHESDEASRFNDGLGASLDGLTFLAFGAVLLGPTVAHPELEHRRLCLAQPDVVRMLPVSIAMLGTRARKPTLAFLGWFGPRGLASIVFAVIVVERFHVPHVQTILETTYVTVGTAVLVHGLSAAQLAERYAHWYRTHKRAPLPTMESAPAAAHRPRGPLAFSAASPAGGSSASGEGG